MKRTIITAVLLAVSLAPVVPASAADSARALYTRTLERERTLRDARNTPTLQQLRAVVTAYERLARRFPSSGYTDNALWQAGNLALLAHARFGQAPDRRTAERLLMQLKEQYPSSSLVARVDAVLAESGTVPFILPIKGTVPNSAEIPGTVPGEIEAGKKGTVPEKSEKGTVPGFVTIRDIKRTPLADGVRVTVEMDGESFYHQERVENPQRVFFDLKRTRAIPSLQDATLKFSDDVVREIRLGRHPQNTTRIVMDMQDVDTYSVFTLYNPFRLVIDFRRSDAAALPLVRLKPDTTTLPPAPAPSSPSASATTGSSPGPAAAPVAVDLKAPTPIEKVPLVSRAPAAPLTAPPAVPATNSNGQFSLARQLGLGISRVVLDAGHGGHDPGAQANGINEAELVLDVALRLRKLIEKQMGIEVTMTRDTDVFIPLEERTAIANREAADLFLSIHANASRNPRARGVETYFLNFSTNPEAEAVAARENSASGRTMHNLPDIVKAIALNNKIDESRDFAATVQRSMVRQLSQRNKQLKDLGVKQAPFVVLIGAGMPSVLAEISFVTNRQEGQMLRTGAYRQHIAEALLEAILRYQQSLKKLTAVATTRETR
jgi:N-acetylmuramoyl-L-alanine amidase